MYYNQQDFDIRLEWGLAGVRELAPISDVLIIVDVLSFSTCVDIATASGAFVFPYRWKDGTAEAYASSLGAGLAGGRETAGAYSLSPVSLLDIPRGTKLVLPSPNGSTLSLATGNTPTLCGGLRNAAAVATYALSIGKKIALIAAGEQWKDGSLRPAFEDFIGCGAIIAHLTSASSKNQRTSSPESQSALAAFTGIASQLDTALRQCSSGKELIGRGFREDVTLAAALNSSKNVPILQDQTYIGRQ